MSLVTCDQHGLTVVAYNDFDFKKDRWVNCPICDLIQGMKDDQTILEDHNKELTMENCEYSIQIESLEENILSLESEIQTHHGLLRDMENEIQDLKSQIRYNEQKISSLEDDVKYVEDLHNGEW